MASCSSSCNPAAAHSLAQRRTEREDDREGGGEEDSGREVVGGSEWRLPSRSAYSRAMTCEEAAVCSSPSPSAPLSSDDSSDEWASRALNSSTNELDDHDDGGDEEVSEGEVEADSNIE